MTRIKICGITNLEDALHAVRCGADALGFIFVEESPRYIGGRPSALKVPLHLPPFLSLVAVRKELGVYEPRWERRFDSVQFYSNPWGASLHGKRLLQVVRLRDRTSLAELQAANSVPSAFVLDAYHPEKLGGSGAVVDWSLAREAVEISPKPIILAGGLTPENVWEAIAAVRPYAVDVSSGVESEPGRKDPEKVRRFIQAVREFDRVHKGKALAE